MNIKKQSEVLLDMLDFTNATTNKVTDYSVGSAVRSIYDAVSIEIDQLYMSSYQNIREGIENGLMSSFGFTKKRAVNAYGYLQISFTTPLASEQVVSAGTSFTSSIPSKSSIIYQVVKSVTVPIGSNSFSILVQADTPGEVGNIIKGGIDTVQSGLANVSAVTNLEDISTGKEEESYESALARFQLFISGLSKATAVSLENATLAIPEISGVYVDEKVGTVNVYAHDGSGNLPSFLQATVKEAVDKVRPAGIQVTVLPIFKTPIDIDVTITLPVSYANNLSSGYDDSVRQYIAAYLDSFTAGKSLVKNELITTIMNFDEKIYDISVNNLDNNTNTMPSDLIRAGSITTHYQTI